MMFTVIFFETHRAVVKFKGFESSSPMAGKDIAHVCVRELVPISNNQRSKIRAVYPKHGEEITERIPIR